MANRCRRPDARKEAGFKQEVSLLLERVKATPRQPGVGEIRIPSERAFRERKQRLADGVMAIDRAVYDAVLKLGAKRSSAPQP